MTCKHTGGSSKSEGQLMAFPNSLIPINHALTSSSTGKMTDIVVKDPEHTGFIIHSS